MSKKIKNSRNTTQVFLIILIAILLTTAIAGIVALFKKGEETSPEDGSVEKTYEETINELTNSLVILTDSNNEYKKQIDTLNSTISNNEDTIAGLKNVISSNNSAISTLNSEIEDKKAQISNLQSELAEMDEENSLLKTEVRAKKNQIASLNSQVANLQTLVTQLQITNDLNLKTIDTLNNQIQSLNSQISELQAKINDNNNITIDLNNKIANLEKSIEYYEQYISNLESDTQAVATFEFDGSVYNIQILNKGGYASVVNPTSTDYVVFNYWTVDGEKIDLASYPITSNTKFIADVTHKYSVKFSVDGSISNTQIVTANAYATTPTTPTKTGYQFTGWSVDGVNLVDLSTYNITADTTFTALFTKQHTVTFLYEDTTLSTQLINNGNYAESVSVEDTTYKVFNGWLLNGSQVDLSTYKIVADTIFVADITYKYDVKFMVDDTEYNAQIVTANGYATIPTDPTKEGYVFDGWSNGTDIVSDIETIPVTANITYVAVFKIPGIFEITWNGLTSFTGQDVWTDGTNIYYSDGSYSRAFILDKETLTWSSIYLNGVPNSAKFYGRYVWTDGTYIYYNYKISDNASCSIKLVDVDTLTWGSFWYGKSIGYGSAVWTDGFNVYYSYYGTNYTLDKENLTWVEKTWNGLTSFNGRYIWTDGTNTYYSYGTVQYVLDKETSTWNIKTWDGLTDFYGYNVWSDGVNTYYSNGTEQYVLDKETSTWVEKTWDGLTSFVGQNVWTDGTNYYYSSGTKQYIIYT